MRSIGFARGLLVIFLVEDTIGLSVEASGGHLTSFCAYSVLSSLAGKVTEAKFQRLTEKTEKPYLFCSSSLQGHISQTMCRLTLYKGKPMLIGDIVTNPDNSLLLQSRDAAYHPGVTDSTHCRNILVNGDGFGVAWYGTDIHKGACCFRFVTPAWSNANLRSIGDHVASSLICAHIRAASSGHDPTERVAVSHENCHPFKYKQFTLMHNGGIPFFSRIKLSLLNLLSEQFFSEIKGSTDSEHVFMLFLHLLHRGGEREFSVEDMAQALQVRLPRVFR